MTRSFDASPSSASIWMRAVTRRGVVCLLAVCCALSLPGCQHGVKYANAALQKLIAGASKAKNVRDATLKKLSQSKATGPVAIQLHRYFTQRYEAAEQRHAQLGDAIEKAVPRLHPDDTAILRDAHASDTDVLSDLRVVLDSTSALPPEAETTLSEHFSGLDERAAVIEKFLAEFG